ncbi:hypothetical protein RJ53_10875 [Methanocalculus chunghsingensis]|uniref:Uncharacterized protein n=1 Tax=Methanocalculus chunghsingensis TaxID=156457 RepID=A0A8J7W8Z7_9EURY|nr:hypothetical protein [Methanocalculus chunghsingensis]
MAHLVGMVRIGKNCFGKGDDIVDVDRTFIRSNHKTIRKVCRVITVYCGIDVWKSPGAVFPCF